LKITQIFPSIFEMQVIAPLGLTSRPLGAWHNAIGASQALERKD
jgi:hypothetical protein